MYEQVASNCFRYFGFRSLDEVNKLTVKEYTMLCEAESYRQIDRQRDIALGAWLSFVATARKGKQGKPVYPTFDKFFNYEKELKKIKGDKVDDLKEKYKALGEILNVNTHDRSDSDR